MPTTFPGDPATYYRHRQAVVLDAAGTGLLKSLAGGTIYVNGAAASVRQVGVGVPVTTVQTSGAGLLPELFVALNDPENDVVTVDWTGDGIDPQVLDLHANEYRDLMRAIATAAGATATAEAAASATTAVSALAQLQAYISENPGGGGDGGVSAHGGLTGLGNDDHLQYALADGTRGAFAPPAHTHPYATPADVAAAQAFATDRTKHSGVQAISSVSGLQSALNGKENAIPTATTLAQANAFPQGTVYKFVQA